MQQMREQWRRWFSSREPAHWMKATFFASLPSARSRRPSGRAVRVGHALELEAGDDVGDAAVAVGLDLRRVVGPPAGGPDHAADLQFDGLLLHGEVDRADLAGGPGLLALGRADDGGVDDVALRVGHAVRQVGRLDPVQAVVGGVGDLRRHRVAAVAAGGAGLGDVARLDLQRDGVVAAGAADGGDLGHGHDAQVGIALEALQVDLEAAGGMAHLGEVAVEQRRAPAEGGQLLGEDDLLAAFGGFERRRHAGDAAAHDEDRLAGSDGC
jgi:hypothetical protein